MDDDLTIGETTVISLLLLPFVPIVFVLSFLWYFVLGLVVLAFSLGLLWLLIIPFIL